jgi:hypothetical protein
LISAAEAATSFIATPSRACVFARRVDGRAFAAIRCTNGIRLSAAIASLALMLVYAAMWSPFLNCPSWRRTSHCLLPSTRGEQKDMGVLRTVTIVVVNGQKKRSRKPEARFDTVLKRTISGATNVTNASSSMDRTLSMPFPNDNCSRRELKAHGLR